MSQTSFFIVFFQPSLTVIHIFFLSCHMADCLRLKQCDSFSHLLIPLRLADYQISGCSNQLVWRGIFSNLAIWLGILSCTFKYEYLAISLYLNFLSFALSFFFLSISSRQFLSVVLLHPFHIFFYHGVVRLILCLIFFRSFSFSPFPFYFLFNISFLSHSPHIPMHAERISETLHHWLCLCRRTGLVTCAGAWGGRGRRQVWEGGGGDQATEDAGIDRHSNWPETRSTRRQEVSHRTSIMEGFLVGTSPSHHLGRWLFATAEGSFALIRDARRPLHKKWDGFWASSIQADSAVVSAE